ncbi:MAG: MXAN_2562 family outer membrane beta-barrel protein [Myxococcota bacterium]
MNGVRTSAAALLLAAAALGTSASASAQVYEDQYSDRYRQPYEDSENYALELRIGAYQPDANRNFQTVYGDQRGPLVGLELDFLPLRIPYVGRIGGGLSFEWAEYRANACQDLACANRADERASFRIFPFGFMAVLRADVLARELGIPIVVTGKIGLDLIQARERVGSIETSSGVAVGLRWAVQVALELDWINPRAGRNLAQEWGINHSFFFFEAFGSTAENGIRVGDDIAYVGGLGLSF